jgi:branched-subunit amino acid transport protein
MVAVIILLGLASFAMRAAGAALPTLPPAVSSRLAGIAPALLAALVVTGLTTDRGVVTLDARFAGVALGAALAVLRVPFAACMVCAAAVTALLRALGVS